jgi:predicted  nucleic acid-binding Zn-ribbon protein
MLTNDDLQKVGKLIDTKQEPLKKNISTLKDDVSTLKSDVSDLKEDVSGLKKDVSGLKKDVKILKKDVSEIRGDIKTLVSYFDRDYVGLRRRVERIEDHLGLPSKN